MKTIFIIAVNFLLFTCPIFSSIIYVELPEYHSCINEPEKNRDTLIPANLLKQTPTILLTSRGNLSSKFYVFANSWKHTNSVDRTSTSFVNKNTSSNFFEHNFSSTSPTIATISSQHQDYGKASFQIDDDDDFLDDDESDKVGLLSNGGEIGDLRIPIEYDNTQDLNIGDSKIVISRFNNHKPLEKIEIPNDPDRLDLKKIFRNKTMVSLKDIDIILVEHALINAGFRGKLKYFSLPDKKRGFAVKTYFEQIEENGDYLKATRFHDEIQRKYWIKRTERYFRSFTFIISLKGYDTPPIQSEFSDKGIKVYELDFHGSITRPQSERTNFETPDDKLIPVDELQIVYHVHEYLGRDGKSNEAKLIKMENVDAQDHLIKSDIFKYLYDE